MSTSVKLEKLLMDLNRYPFDGGHLLLFELRDRIYLCAHFAMLPKEVFSHFLYIIQDLLDG
jgi:hypothetical protein